MFGRAVRILILLTLLAITVEAARKPERKAETPLSGFEQIQLIRGPQNHLLMPAKVNGQPATFLLDTGVDTSFLQSNRAERFGVPALGRETSASGRSFPLGEIADIRIGRVALGPLEVALYTPSQLGGPVPGVSGNSADGIIGLDFLRRTKAVINCRTKQIFFKTDPARRLDLAATTSAMGFQRIPITQTPRGFLTVPCRLRQRTGKLVLDTGAFLTGLDDETARNLDLARTPSKLTARGFDGRTRALTLAKVDDLEVGGLKIAPQKFVVLDVFPAEKSPRVFTGINRIESRLRRTTAPNEPVFGLLGNELLDQRRAIIDLESMVLFLK